MSLLVKLRVKHKTCFLLNNYFMNGFALFSEHLDWRALTGSIHLNVFYNKVVLQIIKRFYSRGFTCKVNLFLIISFSISSIFSICFFIMICYFIIVTYNSGMNWSATFLFYLLFIQDLLHDSDCKRKTLTVKIKSIVKFYF